VRVFDDTTDLKRLLRGVVVLGTGGGGDPVRGQGQIEHDYQKGRTYSIVSPAEVEDDALVVSGGFLGPMAIKTSWSETLERWETYYELAEAVKAMQGLLNQKVDYLVPFETGGGNTIAILSCGARLGIPVVDGDGLGRAAPETQMCSFAGLGVALTPLVFVEANGSKISVWDDDLFFPDALGRFITSNKGHSIANCCYPMTGKQLKETVIPQTITAAIALGKYMETIENRKANNPLDVLADFLNGTVLMKGQVASLSEKTEGGFFWAEARLDGINDHSGHSMRLVMKNEVMAGWIDQKIVSIFPDHLYLIDLDSGQGMLTRYLKKGKLVGVIGRPCHERLRQAATTSAGQEAFSGARYHVNVSYRPTQELLDER